MFNKDTFLNVLLRAVKQISTSPHRDRFLVNACLFNVWLSDHSHRSIRVCPVQQTVAHSLRISVLEMHLKYSKASVYINWLKYLELNWKKRDKNIVTNY